jgi:ribonuclease VapC
MMVVDASAILSIVLQEDDAEVFEAAMARAAEGVITAVNYWEVLARAHVKHGRAGIELAEGLMSRMNISVEVVDAYMARQAVVAFERFHGRPGGRLNLGDCFAYALAAREGDGLLFKGNDFTKTDVKNALVR